VESGVSGDETAAETFGRRKRSPAGGGGGTSDYKMAAVIDGGNIVAVTGYMPMITLYNGRFIWVYDLVTDEAHRSKGYGARLLAHVEKQAGENGYGIVSLSSDLQRKDAHRFYEEKMDYDKVSYVFLKRL